MFGAVLRKRGTMKILVAVKRVVDAYVSIQVESNQINTKPLKKSINPFDAIAVEEAIRWLEKNWASEVVVVSIGDDSVQETIRQTLAMGATRGILVRTDKFLESLNVAKILQKIVEREKPNLIFMGKQSIDGDNNQTPQMLAALLNWPQAMYASNINKVDDALEVTREIDGGLETLKVTLPAVVSTDLRLNEPRYCSLQNIMKAKQKIIDTVELDSLGLSLRKHVEIIKEDAPPVRSGGMIVDSVAALLDKLVQVEKVL